MRASSLNLQVKHQASRVESLLQVRQDKPQGLTPDVGLGLQIQNMYGNKYGQCGKG